MDKLPKVIATSVVRGAPKGESHGGLYIIDLEDSKVEKKIDWKALDIEWEGSGRDRGLRGIAIYGEKVYIASSNEILVLTKDFHIIDKINNKYLGSCHEICIVNDLLYITSTWYDAILIYDLKNKEFIKSYYVKYRNKIPSIIEFNPREEAGPIIDNKFHINNVFVVEDEIYFSGLRNNALFKIGKTGRVSKNQIIPKGTHNVQFFKDGILMNDTPKNCILYKRNGEEFVYKIKTYNENELVWPEGDYFARQSFGRGLTTWKNYIIGGSSPGTISIYKLNNSEPIKYVNITMDVRNSIHGLEVWPF